MKIYKLMKFIFKKNNFLDKLISIIYAFIYLIDLYKNKKQNKMNSQDDVYPLF